MPSPKTLDLKHHTLLQAIMSRGPLSEELTLRMYKSLLKVSSLDGFNSFIGEINKELEFVDMEVKKVTNQNDGKEYFGVINKLASPQAKLGTRYSTAQLSYFKAVMVDIVLEPSGEGGIPSSRALYLSPTDALQVDPTQPAGGSQAGVAIKMTLGAKEEALELLVKDQWLSRTEEGRVSLGTRAFLELRGLFRNLGVPFCEVCNEAAIKAELCKNDQCTGRMHSYCVARKFRARQARVCSLCQTEWASAAPERRGDEDVKVEKRGLLTGKGSNRRASTLVESWGAKNPRSQVSQRSKRSARSKAGVHSPAADEDEDEEEDSGNEEEITRLDSDEDREETRQPRKRKAQKW